MNMRYFKADVQTAAQAAKLNSLRYELYGVHLTTPSTSEIQIGVTHLRTLFKNAVQEAFTGRVLEAYEFASRVQNSSSGRSLLEDILRGGHRTELQCYL